MDEYAFVARHLDDVLRDGIAFVDAEIDAIIDSDAYRAAMARVLAAEFELLYDRPLGDPAALEYLVQGAKAARMALNDSRVREYIMAYKKDTDAFVDCVYGAYIDVYQRAPDTSEVQQWLPLHREGDVPRAIAKVTESLVHGLEFHDVLKKMIRAECLEADGLEPPASTLYRLLDECVGRIALLSTRDAVKKDVQNVVARYIASSST